MKKIGNIKLPLQGTHKINGDDTTVLDYLFDMDLPKLHDILGQIHAKDDPAFMAIRVGKLGFVGIFMYRPPDIWLDYPEQKYQLYISPNIALLIHYWVERRMRTHDIYEAQLLTNMINYLDQFAKLQKVSHT
jgi:hypothetical protein